MNAAQLAAQLAARYNGHAVTKAYGASVTAADMMPTATQICALESRIDGQRARIEDNRRRLEALISGTPTQAPRPAGAGPTDSPLDPIEAEHVNRVITAIEEAEDFG